MPTFLRRPAARAAAAGLLTAAFLFAQDNSGAEAQSRQPAVFVDGKPLAADLLQQGGRLYLRAAQFRHMGAAVEWIQEAQAVRLRKNGVAASFTAKEGVLHRPKGSYVPLRRAAESLGMSVHYDAAAHTAHVNTNSAAQPAPRGPFHVTAEERYWLEQITEAEAGGEPYEGKVAVAASVLNRVRHKDWPDSVTEVIFQVVKVNGVKYYQYTPVLDGRIYEVKPSKETVRAVQAALNGEDPSGGAVVFYNPDKTNNRWVRERPVTATIGNHVFAQ